MNARQTNRVKRVLLEIHISSFIAVLPPLRCEADHRRAATASYVAPQHPFPSTEPRKSLGTWLREISFCSCLTFLPGSACVLLSKICKDFFSALYAKENHVAWHGIAWHGVPHAALHGSRRPQCILVDVQMPLKRRRMGNWMKRGEKKEGRRGAGSSSVGGRTADNKSLRASERERGV